MTSRSSSILSRHVSIVLLAVIIGHCGAKTGNEHGGGRNYHPGEVTGGGGAGSMAKTTRDANLHHSQHKRFGWLKVKPLWMDIEKSCFARTCIAPYAIQVVSIEPSINHTVIFDMDIDNPVPPVDMYFPTPPYKHRSPRRLGTGDPYEISYSSSSTQQHGQRAVEGGVELIPTTANFSVGLFGVDPTYRFPRHCHSMIENTVTFMFPPPPPTHGAGGGRPKRLPSPLPPSIISFGADCLNLTFQLFVIPAAPDSNSIPGDSRGQNEHDSSDGSSGLGASAAASDSSTLTAKTPVPMWIVAILAGVNAALLFAVVALVWHIALSARKKRTKKLRRQRSSGNSSSATATTNSYVPSSTTPMNRRITPPLPPPPPLRPPPVRSMADYDLSEPKYDVPWTDRSVNGHHPHDGYKITFSTLQHRQRDPQFYNYYFSSDEQKGVPSHNPPPIMIGDEMNGDRPIPLRRTNTPIIATTMR